MSAATLAKHLKAWIGVIGHAADECGMLSPKLLHQVNDRTQTAKQCTETFGGLWTWLSGDFRQLPPVGQPSLAQPVPEIDSIHQSLDGSDEPVTADLDPENRALAYLGYKLHSSLRTTILRAMPSARNHTYPILNSIPPIFKYSHSHIPRLFVNFLKHMSQTNMMSKR